MGTVTPDRSQRLTALERANEIRRWRARLKQDIAAGRVDVAALLVAPVVDPRLGSMKVLELLLAVPKVGRVKANRVLTAARVSPSRTFAGVTRRQRCELVVALGAWPAARKFLR